jgi:hypothetical protein
MEPEFSYTLRDLQAAAASLARSQGRIWADLDDADRGNYEADAERVLETAGGREVAG